MNVEGGGGICFQPKLENGSSPFILSFAGDGG